MGVRLRRPSSAQLQELLEDCTLVDLTYSPTGVTITGSAIVGLTRRTWSTTLAAGAFDAARLAIDEWAVHRGAGLVVETDGPIAVGTNVALSAPLPPTGWVDATCRIVAVVDEPDRYGFAYGTLPNHPERGEESFVVTRTAEATRFDIVAVSTPVHPVVRLVPPLGNLLQDAAVRRYLRAMERAVG